MSDDPAPESAAPEVDSAHQTQADKEMAGVQANGFSDLGKDLGSDDLGKVRRDSCNQGILSL